MKTKLSKKEAQKKIDSFFRKSNFTSEQLRKIKRLAMKFSIKLGKYRRLFCKSCLNPLAGKIRVFKSYKTVECKHCSYKNKVKIS